MTAFCLTLFLAAADPAPPAVAENPPVAESPPAVESALLRFSKIGETDAEFVLMPDQIRRTPAWAGDEPNPPVSARAAMANAAAALEKVAGRFPLDAKQYGEKPWGFESLRLLPMGSDDRWIWLVTYRATGRAASAPGHRLEIAVLMNGKVVTPTVAKPAGKRTESRVSETR